MSSSIQTVTVGTVVSTVPSGNPVMIFHPWICGIADFTADREFHPALKIIIIKEQKLLYDNLFDLTPGISFNLHNIAALGQEGKVDMVFQDVSGRLENLIVN